MREFKFIGNANEYVAWTDKPIPGSVYSEDHVGWTDPNGIEVTVGATAMQCPGDWREMIKSPEAVERILERLRTIPSPLEPLHKDTDLGAFSIEIMKGILSNPNLDFATRTDIVSHSTYLAQELIKQLCALK